LDIRIISSTFVLPVVVAIIGIVCVIHFIVHALIVTIAIVSSCLLLLLFPVMRILIILIIWKCVYGNGN